MSTFLILCFPFLFEYFFISTERGRRFFLLSSSDLAQKDYLYQRNESLRQSEYAKEKLEE